MEKSILGMKVRFKTKSGEILTGLVKKEVDWLVGCPVFVDDNGNMFGVGYEGDVLEVLDD